MISNEIIIALIGAVSLIVGALIGIFGQFLGNWLDHKKRINFLVFETFFKQKLSYLEKLSLGLEKVVDHESKILFLLNNLGNALGNQEITPQKVKKIFKEIILNSKNILEDFKLNGMSIYFSDKSTIIAPLKKFILTHTEIIVSLRSLLDNNLKEIDRKSYLLNTIPQNLLTSQNLLTEIRKEMFFIKLKNQKI